MLLLLGISWRHVLEVKNVFHKARHPTIGCGFTAIYQETEVKASKEGGGQDTVSSLLFARIAKQG